MAICPVVPPKLIQPSLNQNLTASLKSGGLSHPPCCMMPFLFNATLLVLKRRAGHGRGNGKDTYSGLPAEQIREVNLHAPAQHALNKPTPENSSTFPHPFIFCLNSAGVTCSFDLNAVEKYACEENPTLLASSEIGRSSLPRRYLAFCSRTFSI